MSCKVCCYGIGTDITKCCVKTGTCCQGIPPIISNCFGSFKIKLLNTLNQCIRMEPWVIEFWKCVSCYAMLLGVFIIFIGFLFGWILFNSLTPLYIGIGFLGLSFSPWLIYWMYQLYQCAKTKYKTLYQRYEKRYNEYVEIKDPENPDNDVTINLLLEEHYSEDDDNNL